MKPSGFFDNLKVIFSNRKILIPLIIVLILFSFAVIYSMLKPNKPSSLTTPPLTPDEGKIVAKVGEEYIYQKDIDRLLTFYGDAVPDDDKNKKELLDNLITESIVLQTAKNEEKISMDSTIYNSPDKDQIKRSQTVEQIKKEYIAQTDSIEGYVVSIWFYNQQPASIGYEAGKQVAYEKINSLYNLVKNSTISMVEAGERIKKDNSLSGLDNNYKNNAIFDFKTYRGEKITFDKNFDEMLWNVPENGVTDVYLAKDYLVATKEHIDALYMFGQVTRKTVTGNNISYDEWLENSKKQIQINYDNNN